MNKQWMTSELSFIGRNVYFFLHGCLFKDSPPTTLARSFFLFVSLSPYTQGAHTHTHTHTHTQTEKHSNSLDVSQRHRSASHFRGAACIIPSQKIKTDHILIIHTWTLRGLCFYAVILNKIIREHSPRCWERKKWHTVSDPIFSSLERSSYSVCSDWNRKWNRDSRVSETLGSRSSVSQRASPLIAELWGSLPSPS